MATNSGAQVVKYVGDDLVQILFEGDMYILNLDEAIAIGANVFTYQGKPISIRKITEVVGINDTSLHKLMTKYPNIHTVEQIIEHYKNQGGPKRNPESRLTYKGQVISYKSAAELLNIGIHPIQNVLKKYPEVSTVEQIIEIFNKNGWPKTPKIRALTYCNRPSSTAEAAKMIGVTLESLRSMIDRHPEITTVEQLIDYYQHKGGVRQTIKLTYNNEAVTTSRAGEICGVTASTIVNLVRQYPEFTTVEQILAYYAQRGGPRGRRYPSHGVTYQGTLISQSQAAEIVGVSDSAISRLMKKYPNLNTVEKIIEYYRRRGKL